MKAKDRSFFSVPFRLFYIPYLDNMRFDILSSHFGSMKRFIYLLKSKMHDDYIFLSFHCGELQTYMKAERIV